jgi:ABC-type glycerol-3-phosphate transport system substrate-binding protein
VLERFHGESGVTVALVSVTAMDLPEKLKVEVGAGRPTIDLFAQDNLALRPLVDGGLVQPLDDVAVPDAVLPAMAPPRFGGTRYFLPFRPNVQVTYANRARFREAGVTLRAPWPRSVRWPRPSRGGGLPRRSRFRSPRARRPPSRCPS